MLFIDCELPLSLEYTCFFCVFVCFHRKLELLLLLSSLSLLLLLLLFYVLFCFHRNWYICPGWIVFLEETCQKCGKQPSFFFFFFFFFFEAISLGVYASCSEFIFLSLLLIYKSVANLIKTKVGNNTASNFSSSFRPRNFGWTLARFFHWENNKTHNCYPINFNDRTRKI